MTWEEFKKYLTDNFTYKRTPGIQTGIALDITLCHDFYNDEPTGYTGIVWKQIITFYEDGRVRICGKTFFNRTPDQMYQIIKSLIKINGE